MAAAGATLLAQEAGIGRPPGRPIRIDPGVLESFRTEARRQHVGYQTLIHEVLAEHIRKDVA